MPELPEVETFRRALEARKPRSTIVRAQVRKAYVLRTPAATLLRGLKGQRLGPTRRHGKELFVRLEPSGRWLRLHFGMDGDFAFGRAGEPLPVGAVLVLDFADGARVCYTSRRLLGALQLLDEAKDFVRERGLGPDALDRAAATLVARLRARRGAVKAALLNQEVVAGVGNLYADEALFQASVHPRAPLERMDDATLGRVVAEVQRALRTAVERGADWDKLPKDAFLPHRRPGGPCPRDGAPLKSIVVGGRTTIFCPQHQRRGAPRRAAGPAKRDPQRKEEARRTAPGGVRGCAQRGAPAPDRIPKVFPTHKESALGRVVLPALDERGRYWHRGVRGH